MLLRRSFTAVATLVVFACLGTGFAACSSDDTSSSTTTTSTGTGGAGGASTGQGGAGGAAMPLDSKTFCAAYAKATCGATDGCGCPTVDGAPSCVAKNTDSCEKSLAGLIGAIALGDVEFDAKVAQACVDEASKALASCPVPTQKLRPAACGGFMRDKAKLGETCSKFGASLFCGGGLGSCDGMTGKCTALPKADEPCPNYRCAEGLICRGGMACAKLGSKGDACNNADECGTGLACIAQKCDAPQAKGASCSSELDCAVGLGCIGGVCDTAFNEGDGCNGGECGPDHTCLPMANLKKCGPKAKLGQVCMGFEDCESGTACDYIQMPSRCIAVAKLGESCATAPCADGLSCSDATCVNPAKLGEVCSQNASKPCVDGLACSDAGKCVAGGNAGEPCVGNAGACAVGSICNYAKMPALCQAIGDVGAACDNNDGLCKAGLFCDSVTGKCSTPLPLGKACTSPLSCGPDGYCAFDAMGGVCKKLPTNVGDACDFQCGTGLRCTGPIGVCAKGACVIR